MKKLAATFLLLFWVCGTVSAQNVVEGKIFDAVSFEPLPGAGVLVAGTSTGAAADAEGRFRLEVPANAEKLVVSSVGYEPRTIALPVKDFMNIALQAGTQQLDEVVVTAYEANRKLLEVPGSVSLLTRRDLERDNDVLIVPALNRVPGVYIHSGALNTNRITIRGIGTRSPFSTNRLRAFLNGIPLTTGDGETTIEDIDLSLIQRVEVIKGPSGSMYGAGLGGAILLKARPGNFNQTSAHSQWITGSYGLQRLVNRVETGSDNFSLNLTHSYMKSDGYRENNEYDRQSIFALAQWLAGEQTQVSFLGQLIDLKSFIPSSIDSATFAENPSAAAGNWLNARGFEDYRKGLFGISVNHRYQPGLQHNTSIFTSFRTAEEPRPFNILREGQRSYGLRSYLTWQPGEQQRHEFTAGLEYFDEWYTWSTYEIIEREYGAVISDNEENRRYANFFGQWLFNATDRLQFTAGLNYNVTSYDYTDLFRADGNDLSGDYSFEPVLSPRLTAVYQLSEDRMLHASVSHGFSPPSLEETLNPEGTINPDIQPETGMNYEVGSRGHVAGGKLFYDISLYTMQIRNLLVARRTAEDAFVGINAGKTSHTGAEMALRYQLLNQGGQQLQLWGNYTWAHYRFQEFVDNDQDYSGNELTGTPEHLLSAGLDFTSSTGLYGNVNYQFTSDIPITDANSLYSEAYQLVNLKAGYRRAFGKLQLDVFGGLQNVFDEKYAASVLVNATGFGGRAPRYYYPGLPRNWFSGVQASFTF